MSPDDALFHRLAGTWRIVLGSLVAFLVSISETIDNSFGAWLRGRVADGVRVVATNAVSVPIDSVVFLLVAFGSLAFIEGQIVVKYAATLLFGLPIVLVLRRFVRPSEIGASRLDREAVPVGIARVEDFEPGDGLADLRYLDTCARESFALGIGVGDAERRIWLAAARLARFCMQRERARTVRNVVQCSLWKSSWRPTVSR